jgi:hypothetical protein
LDIRQIKEWQDVLSSFDLLIAGIILTVRFDERDISEMPKVGQAIIHGLAYRRSENHTDKCSLSSEEVAKVQISHI